MTVQFITCSHWSPRKTSRDLYPSCGAICEIKSLTAGHTYSATHKRECDRYKAAPQEIVAARREFEKQRVAK